MLRLLYHIQNNYCISFKNFFSQNCTLSYFILDPNSSNEEICSSQIESFQQSYGCLQSWFFTEWHHFSSYFLSFWRSTIVYVWPKDQKNWFGLGSFKIFDKIAKAMLYQVSFCWQMLHTILSHDPYSWKRANHPILKIWSYGDDKMKMKMKTNNE